MDSIYTFGWLNPEESWRGWSYCCMVEQELQEEQGEQERTLFQCFLPDPGGS